MGFVVIEVVRSPGPLSTRYAIVSEFALAMSLSSSHTRNDSFVTVPFLRPAVSPLREESIHARTSGGLSVNFGKLIPAQPFAQRYEDRPARNETAPADPRPGPTATKPTVSVAVD